VYFSDPAPAILGRLKFAVKAMKEDGDNVRQVTVQYLIDLILWAEGIIHEGIYVPPESLNDKLEFKIGHLL
jgi:hypothetical protein